MGYLRRQLALNAVDSIRSVHVVGAVDRYLHCHWNRYRRADAVRVDEPGAPQPLTRSGRE